jgi:hypothetical protein
MSFKKIDKTPEKEQTEEIYEIPENPKICKNCNTEKIYLHTTFKNRKGEIIYMTRFNPKKIENKLKKTAA